jgi:hypothetical protein
MTLSDATDEDVMSFVFVPKGASSGGGNGVSLRARKDCRMLKKRRIEEYYTASYLCVCFRDGVNARVNLTHAGEDRATFYLFQPKGSINKGVCTSSRI